jgi:Rrf2 family transcriptional regulator, iron-sulfur cluster assembly transcription factor
MQLSRRADYGIRAMLDVASFPPENMVLTREIADRQGIPHVFLTKIVAQLVRDGLLRAYRGASGGLALGRPAAEISLRDIIESTDGPIALNRCVVDPGSCSRQPRCPGHEVWCQAQRDLVGLLDSMTLARLAVDATKADSEVNP